jgi:hypothetical protein
MNLFGVERRAYLNRGSVESHRLHSAVRDTNGQRAALEVHLGWGTAVIEMSTNMSIIFLLVKEKKVDNAPF